MIDSVFSRYTRWARNKMFGSVTWLATIALLTITLPVHGSDMGAFQRVETETLDEAAFIFPDDFQGESLNIVMLAMSDEQDNGAWQGDALVEWYAALEGQGVLSDEVQGYHFSVMKVPWFVKGLVRRGIAESYEGKMPLSQAGIIFTKNLDKFAAAPGIKLDGQPTLVLVAPDGKLLEAFKGEATSENINAVSDAVAKYLQPEADAGAMPAQD